MFKSLVFSTFILVSIIFSAVYAQDSIQINVSPVYDSLGLNQEVLDTNINENVLLGYCNSNGLRVSEVFKDSFNSEYGNYVPNLQFIYPIVDSLYATQIVIVMGSWCEDSQREVPRMIKILDHLDFPENKLQIIGVNRLKEAPIQQLVEYKIEFVPTIIVFKNNKELGRIVEMPMQTLEDDLLNIIMQ